MHTQESAPVDSILTSGIKKKHVSSAIKKLVFVAEASL